MSRLIRIFDTTLRDGEQSPGAAMNPDEKLMVAKQLARLGVDIIEAGFAYSSPGDFGAVRKASLDDVHAEPGQLLGHHQLLVGIHRRAGRLLAVPERRVEDKIGRASCRERVY